MSLRVSRGLEQLPQRRAALPPVESTFLLCEEAAGLTLFPRAHLAVAAAGGETAAQSWSGTTEPLLGQGTSEGSSLKPSIAAETAAMLCCLWNSFVQS